MNKEEMKNRRMRNFIFGDNPKNKASLLKFDFKERTCNVYDLILEENYNIVGFKNEKLSKDIQIGSVTIKCKLSNISTCNGESKYEISLKPGDAKNTIKHTYIRYNTDKDGFGVIDKKIITSDCKMKKEYFKQRYCYILCHNSPTIPLILFTNNEFGEDLYDLFNAPKNLYAFNSFDQNISVSTFHIENKIIANDVKPSNPAIIPFGIFDNDEISDNVSYNTKTKISSTIEDVEYLNDRGEVIRTTPTIINKYKDLVLTTADNQYLVLKNYQIRGESELDDDTKSIIEKYSKKDFLPYTDETNYALIVTGNYKDQTYTELNTTIKDDEDQDVIISKTIITNKDSSVIIFSLSWNESDSKEIVDTKIYDGETGKILNSVRAETTITPLHRRSVVYNEDLNYRMMNDVKFDLSAKVLKSSNFIYESPELYMNIDTLNNKIVEFESTIYNKNIDKFVYCRDFYGCLYKYNIDKLH